MISVIVCSKLNSISEEFRNNLSATIGCCFELIHIDNSKNEYSIFSAYNLGIERSNYELLCFVHEDVIFHTNDWGIILINYFSEIPLLGCVGIAGATKKTKAPSVWWDVDLKDTVLHLIQWEEEKGPSYFSFRWGTEKWKELSVIDGVFMVTDKSLNLSFDSTLNGFHCYDLNLCIEARKKGLKIIGTNEILIEHFSAGKMDKKWVDATHKFHRKYGPFLPLNIYGETKDFLIEDDNLVKFIKRAIIQGSFYVALFYWAKYFWKYPFVIQNVNFLKMFLYKIAIQTKLPIRKR